MRFNLADEVLPEGTSKKLLHIPGILRASCVKLEEDQIRGADYEIAADPFGPLQEPRLPRELPDHDVNRPFPRNLEPHHTSQRIRQVSLPDLNVNATGSKVRPQGRLQAGSIGDEQIQIEGRTVDPMGGESQCADQGMADAGRIESRPDLLEQVHPISSDMHFEGVRPACR